MVIRREGEGSQWESSDFFNSNTQKLEKNTII